MGLKLPLPRTACVLFLLLQTAAQGAEKRPNFLFVLVDSQRYDSFSERYMPRTWKWMSDGVRFEQAFTTSPLSCPSIASTFTGTYPHTHGLLRNDTPLRVKPKDPVGQSFERLESVAQALSKAGYRTGLVGKYLNCWGWPARKSEFNYWVSFLTDDVSNWFDYKLNINGVETQIDPKTSATPYITDQLLFRAQDFLDSALKEDRPFFLYFAPPPLHKPYAPAPRHSSLYLGERLEKSPSFDEEDISGKPQWMSDIAGIQIACRSSRFCHSLVSLAERIQLGQLQGLAGVDEAVDSLLLRLKKAGKLDNTVVLFTSDQGFMRGEHRLFGNNRAYEEVIHVPLALRYPGLIPTGGGTARSDAHLVANVDLAPTIYELAGLPPPPTFEGRSLVPLIKGTASSWRQELLIEGWPDMLDGYLQCSPPFRALRTGTYAYIESLRNQGNVGCLFETQPLAELYDLSQDPFELKNLIHDPKGSKVAADLSGHLHSGCFEHMMALPSLSEPEHLAVQQFGRSGLGHALAGLFGKPLARLVCDHPGLESTARLASRSLAWAIQKWENTGK